MNNIYSLKLKYSSTKFYIYFKQVCLTYTVYCTMKFWHLSFVTTTSYCTVSRRIASYRVVSGGIASYYIVSCHIRKFCRYKNMTFWLNLPVKYDPISKPSWNMFPQVPRVSRTLHVILNDINNCLEMTTCHIKLIMINISCNIERYQ